MKASTNKDSSNKDILAVAKEEPSTLKTKPRCTTAGGLPAIFSTFKQIRAETGVIKGIQLLLKANQSCGFDCPGCAWPDPKHDDKAITEFCENGVKAIAEEASFKRVNKDFFKHYSVAELSHKSDIWLSKQGRLTEPMILKEGSTHYEPISWDEAYNLIAKKLNSLNNPDEAIFYTSGRASNEAAFLYQLFVREFGTNNLPDCSNLCHESSGQALMETIGIGKGTVTLEDFPKADLIIVFGQNPATNHPRMLSSLEEAKLNGTKIVSVNPLNEAGLDRFKHPQNVLGLFGKGQKIANLKLNIKINGDAALIKGTIKLMLDQEKIAPGTIFNLEFIKKYTQGFDEFISLIEKTTWEDILSQTGLQMQQIEEFAKLCINSNASIACWAMGLTQHENGVAAIQEIVNLLLLGGHLGREGAGVCPVRGHSNVQGDRTMGIWEKPREQFLQKLEQEFQLSFNRKNGYNAVEAIQAMLDKKSKVFIALGGNFLSAAPDTLATAQAFNNCNLTVQISTKLNRSHLITGKTGLLLPCLGRTDLDLQKNVKQFVTVENSMGIVHRSAGNFTPPSQHLKSEVEIVSKIAQATKKNSPIQWQWLSEDYHRIRDSISRVIPGFENYNERVYDKDGFDLPNPPKDNLTFTTPSKKACFTAHDLPKLKIEKDQFIMMTIRTHDQFNTTIYGMDDRYRGIFNDRRVILVNPEDLKNLGLKNKDIVDITSHHKGKTREVKRFTAILYDIPKGCVATYFPEANPLVPLDQYAKGSMTPCYKSVIVSFKATS
ncbi:MAG: FdhF/YdeP family oxidoreductase [Candidatus Cloacimonetes bacterium]|nr:FdhF/YdeP family oxidoreductase [Candidatus Cloacimonadota bacterium]